MVTNLHTLDAEHCRARVHMLQLLVAQLDFGKEHRRPGWKLFCVCCEMGIGNELIVCFNTNPNMDMDARPRKAFKSNKDHPAPPQRKTVQFQTNCIRPSAEKSFDHHGTL